ncbi:SDR family NAD(P)-dependent oxidoreductase [Marinovum sp. 2_MG-2023]|uniref:SDR family NAD(P)-dependent oxidoreductase n=1 Tax=unclassified Marinovum TaxID=2647166 RepID=UPI0026E347C0|nr:MULTISPECIES: SDR family NAD(P)-dependent oxidoreductase [unclassified Marinovum]MDO6731479.1 SDR family NAD(P)-dependent oxidoreductase [Marinovum sp. 2_MG-2023]MDO6780839.1 SDR family NAD(P)-dependent oxidoreductase [Marinovum sp. 1_MG-2023]
MDIEGKTILVTGANSGLGAGVAARLLADGANVVGIDIATDGAPQHDRFALVKADVTAPDQVAAAIETAKSRFGALHGLVNCAGIAPGQKIVGRDGAHDLALFSKAVSINLIGTFNTMRLAAEAMAGGDAGHEGERGVIINTASIAAFDGQIGQAAYAASKGGVVSLTLPAARELARSGIRVMAIAPGIFETPMMAGLPQEVQDSLGAKVPFPARLGKASEFAELVAAIFANPMLNGEVIRLDGALRMTAK